MVWPLAAPTPGGIVLSTRRLLAVATSLFVASSLPAQGVSWGPAVGLNLATLAGDDVTDAKTLTGAAIGAQIDRHTAGKALFWRFGAHYSMQGAKVEDAGPPVSTLKYKINYLNVPVLAGWKFTTASATGPYLLAGPQLGINVSCNLEAESGTSTASITCDDAGIQIRAMDFAAVVGIGTGFAMGASMVHVAATYGLGLMTIDDGDPDADVKNRVFAITLSYMMPRQRKVN